MAWKGGVVIDLGFDDLMTDRVSDSVPGGCIEQLSRAIT